MTELTVHYNRYDGTTAAEMIDSCRLRIRENGAWMQAPLGDDDEFEIHFDTPAGCVSSTLLNAARSLLHSIHLIDNLVQESCARECMKSGLHSNNYESLLTYVVINSSSQARLGYFGAVVNTQWEECALFDNGKWKHAGTVVSCSSAGNI
jgi:hypothetical protein